MNAVDLDGVTIDAYGTLLTIVDSVAALHELLPGHAPDAIERAFHREAAYYREHASDGTDSRQLRAVRERSVAVFNEALGSTLSPETYAGAFRFDVLPGARSALSTLRALGLTLGVVANWDVSLRDRLDEHGLSPFFAAVVPAANKPAPEGLVRALELLRVDRRRALHIGDGAADEHAARAAGVRFLSAPLPEAVASIA